MIGSIFLRILQSIPVLLIVGFVSFVMFAFIGDPVTIMLGPFSTEAERAQLSAALGLDQPFYVQYLRFMWAAANGEFGVSFRLARPVSHLILERLPATVELALTATVMAIAIGIPMGIYSGLKPRSPISRAFMVGSLVGVSLPPFLVGILLILIFSVTLGWLPSFGRGDTVNIGWWTTGFLTASGLKALILPSITLGLFQLTLIVRLIRSELLEVLRTDFIRFARARGLKPRAIYFGHALRNTLVPAITIIALQIGGVVAFSLVTETVFQWPGLGLLLIQAISAADIPVISAYLLLIAVLFVMINLVVDLLYLVVDPRLRTRARAAGGSA